MAWQPPSVGSRATWTRTFSADDVEAFARLSGDRNPLHFDADYAARTRAGRLVVQGGLTTGLFNALVAMELPGPGSVFLHQEWDYPAPVFIGDTVTAEAEVVEARADKPITRLRCVAQARGRHRGPAGHLPRVHDAAGRTLTLGDASPATTSPAAADPAAPEAAGRWRLLALLSVGELLAMSPWFSASAVAPLITPALSLHGLDLPLLTIAVQLGFVAGALALAVTGAPDVLPARWLFLAGALGAAIANLGFAYASADLGTALLFRFVTGLAMAGVYPVGMKIVAGWFRRERGLAIGILVGALTVGSSLPYLFRSIGALSGLDWRAIVASASVAGIVGGVLVGRTVERGPFDVPAPRFSIEVARRAFAEPSVRLANLGYLGHMWELYAMWTWIPLFFAASFTAAGVADPATSSLAAFVVVAAGGVGCALAGLAADRVGRTTLTIAAMAISGSCSVAIGLLFGAAPWLTLVVGLVWGVSVVADSAQFSAAVTELGPPGTAGSALALQTAAGFLLTGITILLVGLLSEADALGWRLVFALLAVGPLVGVVAMWRLRGRPDAVADGQRQPLSRRRRDA